MISVPSAVSRGTSGGSSLARYINLSVGLIGNVQQPIAGREATRVGRHECSPELADTCTRRGKQGYNAIIRPITSTRSSEVDMILAVDCNVQILAPPRGFVSAVRTVHTEL